MLVITQKHISEVTANSNEKRGDKDFSVDYVLKARNIRDHIKIQHVITNQVSKLCNCATADACKYYEARE